MSSSKKRKQGDISEFIEDDKYGTKRCIGCCYRVTNSTKDFQKHLKSHGCDKVKICTMCGIFRTVTDSMYKEHQTECTGKLLEEKEEEGSSSEEEVVVEKPKKKKPKTKKVKK